MAVEKHSSDKRLALRQFFTHIAAKKPSVRCRWGHRRRKSVPASPPAVSPAAPSTFKSDKIWPAGKALKSGLALVKASAIASFSANEVRAVVDGNVYRLLARFFAISLPINSGQGKKVFSDLANKLIDKKQAGTYNQAAMEFGALVCKPRKPECYCCPLRPDCAAFNTGQVNLLPVKIKTQKIRERYFNYIIAIENDGILMNKRGPNDIWGNLYEFPLFETERLIDAGRLTTEEKFVKAFGTEVHIKSVTGPVKHILSHQKLWATFFEIENYTKLSDLPEGWTHVKMPDLETLAQPKLIFHFLENFFKLKD